MHVCMYVRMYAFSTKSIMTFLPHKTEAHFRKKHKYLKYLLLQWSSYIIINILFISTCHYATNTRNITTEVLKLAAEIAVA